MGLFNEIVETYFKLDSEGKDLIFPYGNLGAGYFLISKKQKAEISRYLNKVYTIVLPLLCLIGVVFGILISSTVFLVFLIWHYFFFKNLTARLTLSQEKMKFSELVSTVAHSYGLVALFIAEFLCIVLIILGIIVAAVSNPIAGAIGAVIFMVFAPIIGFMIYLKLYKK